MSDNQLEYILAANKVAMELYKESKKTLLESASFDFMVYRFSEWDEALQDLEEWEDYISIDEVTYVELYSNLCTKLSKFIDYL